MTNRDCEKVYCNDCNSDNIAETLWVYSNTDVVVVYPTPHYIDDKLDREYICGDCYSDNISHK